MFLNLQLDTNCPNRQLLKTTIIFCFARKCTIWAGFGREVGLLHVVCAGIAQLPLEVSCPTYLTHMAGKVLLAINSSSHIPLCGTAWSSLQLGDWVPKAKHPKKRYSKRQGVKTASFLRSDAGNTHNLRLTFLY